MAGRRLDSGGMCGNRFAVTLPGTGANMTLIATCLDNYFNLDVSILEYFECDYLTPLPLAEMREVPWFRSGDVLVWIDGEWGVEWPEIEETERKSFIDAGLIHRADVTPYGKKYGVYPMGDLTMLAINGYEGVTQLAILSNEYEVTEQALVKHALESMQ